MSKNQPQSPLPPFLYSEAAGGILLLGCALVALFWANLHPESYRGAFDFPHFPLRYFINDGLMAVFFFVVGMEIKRELVIGELNSIGKASLPAVAAVGGMVVPAVIFLAFNWGGPGRSGWGIPMATDIAFCVGILKLLKSRVPNALIVFVTALAVFDDIGGILVIAFFYGHGLSIPWLIGAVALSLVLLCMNRAYVISGIAYALVGVGLWYALHHAGIHATIAGVVVGLMIPAKPPRIGKKIEAPIERFVHRLRPLVAFVIMPAFALANSGVALGEDWISNVAAPVALGTAVGLLFGKPIGVFGFTLLAVRLGIAPIPGGASVMKLFGVSVIAGIGFTVALFIAGLAFPDAPYLLDQAKVGIILGSLTAGVIGFVILRLTKCRSRASFNAGANNAGTQEFVPSCIRNTVRTCS